MKTDITKPSTAVEAETLARSVQSAGGRVVFTNGVFDLLHPGHVRYLAEAKRSGTVLIVGVNSDRSVRAIKGPSRPVNPEAERVEMLLALSSVDAAVVFDEDTPQRIIERLQPDVLVKGSDWDADAIVGRAVVEARGGHVIRVDFAEGYSTTELIRRAQGRGKERRD